MKLTLELDIGREGSKSRGAEGPLLGNVVVRQRTGLGE